MGFVTDILISAMVLCLDLSYLAMVLVLNHTKVLEKLRTRVMEELHGITKFIIRLFKI